VIDIVNQINAAHREIGNDATSTRMNKGFAGTGHGIDQGLHSAAMVARGRIDDGISGPRFSLQHCCVIKRTDDLFDAEGGNAFSFCSVTNQAANFVTSGNKGYPNCATYKTTGTG